MSGVVCFACFLQVVFLLWGGQAHLKGAKINTQRHLVLKSPHPSGLSANRATPEYPQGYFNNHHFTKANQYLVEHGLPEVDWKLPR
jgi:uracil-DNA glycosylase